MNRVLLSADAVGGVWSYTLDLAADWAARGVRVVLAILGPPPNAIQAAAALAIPGLELRITDLSLDWTAADSAALHRSSLGLAQLAAERQVNSVHLHAPALIGAVDWPVPVVVVAHSCVGTWWRVNRCGDLPQDLAWRAAATAQGLRDASAVIAPGAAFADLLRTTYDLVRSVHVIHNGRTPPVLPDVPSRGGAVTVGRLWDDAKNVKVLDRAAGRLSGEVVLAAGAVEAPDGSAISLQHLRALGSLKQDELARCYASCSVFASVARYEPFGLAILEAAQAGLALLLSDIPAFRELWDGVAFFVPPDDEDAIADGLRTLLCNPTPWAERAKDRASRYTVSAMAAASLDVHEAVLAREIESLR